MLRIYNTLTKRIEDFKPLNDPNVNMYTCGPTPYDLQHIGNFRTSIFSDTLTRVLKLDRYSTKTVRNITNIEDKIIKKSKEEGISPKDLTEEFTQIYFSDLDTLNVLPVDVSPNATEHIGKMVKYIEDLITKGFAYVEKDGSVYFDISKFPEYGKLSRLDQRELKTGTRILSDEYEKDNVQDFALWKSVESNEFGYDSPWGKGRPGWHIECSVMSQEYLGDTFDLHLGGIDLIFPHHENEIAQSEAKTGKPFVNYFVHGEMMMVDGKKMSKSLGNIYTLKDLAEKGLEPLSFRYLCLTAHYRDKLNFTWDSLRAAQNALNNLRNEIRGWSTEGNVLDDFFKRFMDNLNNDLNTPQALAVLWEMVKSDTPNQDKGVTILKMDQTLGLNLEEYIGKKIEIPEGVWKLVNQREEARINGNFQKSDEIRERIKRLGFEVMDSPNGPEIKPA